MNSENGNLETRMRISRQWENGNLEMATWIFMRLDKEDQDWFIARLMDSEHPVDELRKLILNAGAEK